MECHHSAGLSSLSFVLLFFFQELPDRMRRAVTYLENRLPSLTYPYAVAMASYALANAKKLNREILFKFISPGVVTRQYSSPNIQKLSL